MSGNRISDKKPTTVQELSDKNDVNTQFPKKDVPSKLLGSSFYDGTDQVFHLAGSVPLGAEGWRLSGFGRFDGHNDYLEAAFTKDFCANNNKLLEVGGGLRFGPNGLQAGPQIGVSPFGSNVLRAGIFFGAENYTTSFVISSHPSKKAKAIANYPHPMSILLPYNVIKATEKTFDYDGNELEHEKTKYRQHLVYVFDGKSGESRGDISVDWMTQETRWRGEEPICSRNVFAIGPSFEYEVRPGTRISGRLMAQNTKMGGNSSWGTRGGFALHVDLGKCSHKAPQSCDINTMPPLDYRDRVWLGPIIGNWKTYLTNMYLWGAEEKYALAENGNRAALMAYKDFDPTRPPLVYVHALVDPGACNHETLEALHKAGYQVFVVAYDDMGKSAEENGREIANALKDLRSTHYPEGVPLDVLGHSYGGLNAQMALQSLGEVDNRAGFGKIRMRTIDTFWEGSAHEPPTKKGKNTVRLLSAVMSFFDVEGPMDMRGSSHALQTAFVDPDPSIEFGQIAVRNPKGPGGHGSLPELDPEQQLALINFFCDPETTLQQEPFSSTPRLANYARMLQADYRFEKLQTKVQEAVNNGELSRTESSNTNLLGAIFDDPSTVGRIEGTHVNAGDHGRRSDKNFLGDLLLSDEHFGPANSIYK